jgi:hypothetical protein
MEGIQQERGAFRSQDLKGMGLKGESHSGAADLFCPLDDFFEDGLVAKMHAVEVSEGEHRIGKFL